MATDQLALYNIALRAVGERAISLLTEDREPRRLLDGIWTSGGGAIKAWLEQGLWNFAIRAVQIDATSSVDPAFGYSNAFDVPSDFVRLVSISAGEFFNDPLTRYELEGVYIYADVDPIYLRFVSDGADWGNDLSRWPETFTRWAGHWLAVQLAPTFTNDINMQRLEKRTNRLLIDARSKDASQEPPRWPPLSSWARARGGRTGGRRDGGSRSRLIG